MTDRWARLGYRGAEARNQMIREALVERDENMRRIGILPIGIGSLKKAHKAILNNVSIFLCHNEIDHEGSASF